MFFTSSGVKSGFIEKTKAATPATIGDAKDVPFAPVEYPSFPLMIVTPYPGAQISTLSLC